MTLDEIRARAIRIGYMKYLSSASIDSFSGAEAYAAGIDAYEAAMIHPIAEAPKDGTPILTFDGDSTCQWCEDFWNEGEPGIPAGWDVCADSIPTHFRPLPPEPPECEREEEQKNGN